MICPRTPSPSTSARAPRARPSRSPPGWDPRALRATTRRLRPPRARAARQSTRARLHAQTCALFGRWDASLRAPLSVYPIPDKEWSAPVRTTGSSRWSRGGATVTLRARSDARVRPVPSVGIDPARRALRSPRPPAPEGDPLRPYEPRPDETSLPAPLVPDPEQRPAREPPAAPPPSCPGPILVPPESTLTPNPPHRMSPTRPSSDRPRPKSPARWTRARRESRGAPRGFPRSLAVNKSRKRPGEQSQRAAYARRLTSKATARACTPPHARARSVSRLEMYHTVKTTCF